MVRYLLLNIIVMQRPKNLKKGLKKKISDTHESGFFIALWEPIFFKGLKETHLL